MSGGTCFLLECATYEAFSSARCPVALELDGAMLRGGVGVESHGAMAQQYVDERHLTSTSWAYGAWRVACLALPCHGILFCFFLLGKYGSSSVSNVMWLYALRPLMLAFLFAGGCEAIERITHIFNDIEAANLK
eukprot:gnl/MRDRNA2_/MRDRNA2_66542_c0_seq1.p1 gnl/MRDRNA2_/MRDRNA2_66542_c0~~gnl/MRDRNA2_/MRDRNA2_66542_c0_seq1.p1  ORF type:complete len:134 (-),score=15.40 gnl/MRDRNA2_/MRDRNA2_66542_c0_seq1:162-563(-)